MPFIAYDLSLELVRALRKPLTLVRQRNADLARQLDRAADSVALNLAEAGGAVRPRPNPALSHRLRQPS